MPLIDGSVTWKDEMPIIDGFMTQKDGYLQMKLFSSL